jgi:hypothetical protein
VQRTARITSAVVTAAVLAIAPATGAAAKKKPATAFSCTLELFAQGAPDPSGIQFGFATCPSPFGKGVHYSAYTVTPPGPGGPGKVSGTFKNHYDSGTTHGTFALTFTPPASPGNITYTGTVTYTGGTAKFRHVAGSGTIECTTSDGGAHKACTVNSKLAGI